MALHKDFPQSPYAIIDPGLRCSHDNPGVKEIYAKFLDKPGSEKSHKLLHTCYYARNAQFGVCEKEVTHKHHAGHGHK